MKVESQLLVRGSQQPNYAEGDEVQIAGNSRGAAMVANDFPLLTTIVAAGNSYWASMASGGAPVTAIPTTAALFGLYNGEPDNGKSYIIDSIFAVQIVITAAIQNIGILANISQAQITTAIANTITPRSLRGNLPYRGAARVAVGLTLNASDGVASNWMPIGNTGPGQNTLQIGTVVDVDVKGLIIIPPKGQLSLSALGGAATAASVLLGCRWHEAILPQVV